VAVTGFYPQLYFCQSYCWYAFIMQDYLMYYRYTQKWVNLFHTEPLMMEIETAHYIKGMHNLISAHFDLKNYEKFDKTLQQFETFAASDTVTQSENNSIQVFVYLYIAKINRHFLHGTFTEGLVLVPEIIKKLKEYALYLDRHRVLVFYYKIASLYFGSGDYENAIAYLSKIINWKVDLRNDLQCYARLLHLIAHYELGNYDLLEYLVKSVYRFMAKMENLGAVEEQVFKFLQRSFHLSATQLKPEFEKLLCTLKQYENNRFETRAFAYLDIISWLESKINNLGVEDVIATKYRAHKRYGNKEQSPLSKNETSLKK
jgi:tetratricopeptide (TPR) repeat protein